MFQPLEPGYDLCGRSSQAQPIVATDPLDRLGPEATVSVLAGAAESVADIAPLLGKHYVEVLRQLSGASGHITSGQAVCLTCHWEGPLRFGARAAMLDDDAAGHANAASGQRSPQFVGP